MNSTTDYFFKKQINYGPFKYINFCISKLFIQCNTRSCVHIAGAINI